METKDFDFNLPEALIAQHPIEKRDHSRMLVVNKNNGDIHHRHFYDIVDFLTENDVLVINETKVIPARLIGSKIDTKAVIELLLLKEIEPNVWETLVKPAKRIKIGSKVIFGNTLVAECILKKEDGTHHFRMSYEGVFLEVLEHLGTMPLPPYIHERLEEQSRYQTVYAKNAGSAAAPTAGLHFTKELMERLDRKGVDIVPITLHVGLGTFKPVSVEKISEHKMHEETYMITDENAEKLNKAIKDGKNIVAVGTTSLRALESNYNNGFKSGIFNTSIFIYPGYKFKAVNELITNFHLPKSTLVMLVSAFSSTKIIKKAYNEAILHRYRFFSFGDAMYLTRKLDIK
ncbi:MAG TPA: tRNA preQ1(34) S-adenosylmethionine ribosyltransferase-isomerase QueA [Acholeplasma sp.]|nr:tRNA preQ1(34) S-adenosylmethionine ribosyltransferase-isomerase QueA [Acholeplasma sp.]